jgi:tetratricopeptide (TPR) repeat protein
MMRLLRAGAPLLVWIAQLLALPAWASNGEDAEGVKQSRPVLVEPTRPASQTLSSTVSGSTPVARPEPPVPKAGAIDVVTAASDPVRALARAHDAYAAGDYAAAAAGYRALIAAGHDHPLLHYDLGNAYLQHGELGRSIASYRRAAAGAPRDQDVAANLAYARKSARDAVAPPEPPMVWRTVFAWHYRLSRTELWTVAIVLNFVLFALLAVRLLRPREALTWAAAAAALLLAAALASVAMHELDPTRVAVVLPREIDARAGNEEESAVRFKLHAGSEVLVRDELDGWLRIVLPSGEQGWIAASQAEVVEF